jgi:hypothetical protein
MTLQDKMQSVTTLLEAHNALVKDELKVDIEKFKTNLALIGATSEERCKSLSHEDILECLPSYAGIKPRLLAKDLAKIFRDKEEVKPTIVITDNKVKYMSNRQLIEAYSPSSGTDAVSERLNKLSKGKAFIVFNNDGSVDVDTSLKLLEELLAGYSERDFISVNNEVKSIYKVGEKIDNDGDQNPIYKNRLLRPDGTCDQTGRSYAGVPFNVKQLIKVIVDYGDSGNPAMDINAAHNLIDLAIAPDAFNVLKTRYPKSALKFAKLEKENKLPSLRLSLSEVSKKNNLLNSGRVVKF